MNIYLLVEDGASFCIKAKSMGDAVGICESSYMEDREEEEGAGYDAGSERQYYHEQILQSCSLVAELKN